MSLFLLPSVLCTLYFCDSTEATRSLVLVFPEEPVMPTMVMPRSLRYLAASFCKAAMVLSTMMMLPLSGIPSIPSCQKLASMPFSNNPETKLCPSTLSPITGTKSSLSLMSLESMATPVTVMSGSPQSFPFTVSAI